MFFNDRITDRDLDKFRINYQQNFLSKKKGITNAMILQILKREISELEYFEYC